MDTEFLLGGDKNVPKPDHEEGDTTLSIYFLNIFYRNQKTVF